MGVGGGVQEGMAMSDHSDRTTQLSGGCRRRTPKHQKTMSDSNDSTGGGQPSGAASCSEFPWFATNEKQECQIVKPRQVIMGNWLLMRNREGVEWFVPFPELRPNTPND